MSFDIVIPLGPNDFNVINDSINYTIKNVKDYRNIYIVCSHNFNLQNCVYISEDIFPFNLQTVKDMIKNDRRAGWYLQQLIKLYSGFYIPGILENYLVLDADVFILKPISFIENNRHLFSFGSEYHIPYFEHMKRLHPELIRRTNVSGICHHMIFNRNYLSELFSLVEKNKDKKFWEIFLYELNPQDTPYSGASEYEIYFNFMIHFHKDDFKIRNLKWLNHHNKEYFLSNYYDYIAIHYYIRS
jgi:hypothetical protein